MNKKRLIRRQAEISQMQNIKLKESVTNMTQENKLLSIDYLADRLANECQAAGCSFSIAIHMDENVLMVSSGGNAGEVAEGILKVEEQLEEEVGLPFELIKDAILEDCDCEICQSKNQKIEPNKSKASDDELFRFLTALFEIAGGENRDD